VRQHERERAREADRGPSWARTTHQDDEEKYLYLRGARRPDGIPYGVSNLVTSGTRSETTDLLLVEGVLDVHILQANGVQHAAALGGTAASPRLFEQLAKRGISDVTLALDNDPAGVAATHRAIDAAIRADRSPRVWVVDPDLYDDTKDPGEVVQRQSEAMWLCSSLQAPTMRPAQRESASTAALAISGSR
jgi:DNA primase